MRNTEDEIIDIEEKLQELGRDDTGFINNEIKIIEIDANLDLDEKDIKTPERIESPINLFKTINEENFTAPVDTNKPGLKKLSNVPLSDTVNGVFSLEDKLDFEQNEIDLFSIPALVEFDSKSENSLSASISEYDSDSSLQQPEIKSHSTSFSSNEDLSNIKITQSIHESLVDNTHDVVESFLSFKLPENSKFLVSSPEIGVIILPCALSGSISKLVNIQTKLVNVASITFIKKNNIKSDFELLKL